MKSHWYATCAMVLLSSIGIHATSAAEPGPAVQPNDRVVFLGDSITEQRLYTRYVQQYLLCRYPDYNLTFYNAGWGGDTANGGRGRLQRDVLYLKPSLVTVFFGMNDGSYTTFNPGIVEGYRGSLEGLIKDIQTGGARAAVFSPGCVDYSRSVGLASNDYNRQLAAMAIVATNVAALNGCVGWANMHESMARFQAERKAEDPGFSMIPDSVHPDPKGHLFMTGIMLKGLHAEPLPELGSIDLNAGTFTGVRLITQSVGVVELETLTPMPVPFWYDAGQSKAEFIASGLDQLASQKFTAKGLAKGKWRLFIDDVRAAKCEADEYAAGVMIDGSYSAPGHLLHDLIERKENQYFELWRNVRVPGLNAGTRTDILDALVGSDDAYQKAIRLASQPAPARLTLRQVPEGTNLALHARVTTSDPGTEYWPLKALTDGDWTAAMGTCFATAGTTNFPKWADVDLGAVHTIYAANVLVPGFGSTKTIQVTVSEDGTNFTQVGELRCQQNHELRRVVMFVPVKARHVRLVYPDHYGQGPDPSHSPNEVFTAELEVYPAPAE